MRKKELMVLLLIYSVLFTAGTILYVLCFRTGLFSHVSIFFYRGLILILFWGLLISLIMTVLKLFFLRKIITVRDILLLFCVFCCINTVAFTHLPVTADRSITVYMLGYMSADEQAAYTQNDLEQAFVQQYVLDQGAFKKRLEEQLISGTIRTAKDGQFQITERGKALVRLYDKIADWYQIDKKLIHPDPG